jgi:poly(3-hydroxyalkanoate) synthetase
MYGPTGASLSRLAFVWPALLAESANQFSAAYSKQLANFAVGPDAELAVCEPNWATPNAVSFELTTVRLRDFSLDRRQTPTLVCTPYALHASNIVDFAPGHSLMATLRDGGLRHLFATDWRSADPTMRYLGVDAYLADLNVLVDELGGLIDLIGICQGGWMALVYAARFPAKVRKLVIAGAPVDISAGQSGLSILADMAPPGLFHQLVRSGDGRVLGRQVQKFWCPAAIDQQDVHRILEPGEEIGSPGFKQLEATFRDWEKCVLDLPGSYYLEVTERLFKNNYLARGRFIALGRKITLGQVSAPIFLLAARDDEIVGPEQLFATATLVGTPAHLIIRDTAPCNHLGLFIGGNVLQKYWRTAAGWITDDDHRVKPRSLMAMNK